MSRKEKAIAFCILATVLGIESGLVGFGMWTSEHGYTTLYDWVGMPALRSLHAHPGGIFMVDLNLPSTEGNRDHVWVLEQLVWERITPS